MMSVTEWVLVALGAIATLGLAIEAWWQSRPSDRLELLPEGWSVDRLAPDWYRLTGKVMACNANPMLEVTLANLEPRLKLLSNADTNSITSRIHFTTNETARNDNYWQATILSPNETLPIEFEIDLRGDGLADLESGWLQLHYIQYGRQARTAKLAHAIIPLQDPQPTTDEQWQQRDGALVLPVKTHLLNNQDTLPELVERYLKPLAQPGDYVALAESATAIVEGNFRHPSSIQLGWWAQRLCYLFPSKTSLSSAYGMQTLIDTSSAWRVVGALMLGAVSKALGKPGVFYALAGYQAALLDDVTGTLPPYDQFIVLGPDDPQQTVDRVKASTGLETAIVDANDLKEVKILAATAGIVPNRVFGALRENPAGNAAEQTPLLLIRPNPA